MIRLLTTFSCFALLTLAAPALSAQGHSEWDRSGAPQGSQERGPSRTGKPDRPGLGSGAEHGKHQAFGDEDREEAMQLAMLERFLNMPPEKLAEIRETIEQVEAMSEEEREAMRQQIAEYRKLRFEKRRALLDAFRKVPQEEREQMREYWQSLSPEEREQKRRTLREMSQEERMQWRQRVINGQ